MRGTYIKKIDPFLTEEKVFICGLLLMTSAGSESQSSKLSIYGNLKYGLPPIYANQSIEENKPHPKGRQIQFHQDHSR